MQWRRCAVCGHSSREISTDSVHDLRRAWIAPLQARQAGACAGLSCRSGGTKRRPAQARRSARASGRGRNAPNEGRKAGSLTAGRATRRGGTDQRSQAKARARAGGGIAGPASTPAAGDTGGRIDRRPGAPGGWHGHTRQRRHGVARASAGAVCTKSGVSAVQSQESSCRSPSHPHRSTS